MKILLGAIFAFLTILLSSCRTEDFYDSNSNFLDRMMFDSPEHTSQFDSSKLEAQKKIEKPNNVFKFF